MTINYWIGQAEKVAQVTQVSITSNDASTTYTITIGGIDVSVTGAADAATTASNLASACNASTHPYFSVITWSSSGSTISGTADVAGVPFTYTVSTWNGSGAFNSTWTSTANGSPHNWNDADNWSEGNVPSKADAYDTVIADCDIDICWIPSSAGAASLRIEPTYTGRIGLDNTVFAY